MVISRIDAEPGKPALLAFSVAIAKMKKIEKKRVEKPFGSLWFFHV